MIFNFYYFFYKWKEVVFGETGTYHGKQLVMVKTVRFKDKIDLRSAGIPFCGESIAVEAPNKIWKYEGVLREAHYSDAGFAERNVYLMCQEGQ